MRNKKTVLVTGGSRGIGKQVCMIFEENNWNVWAPPRQELDLSSNESIKAFIDGNKNENVHSLINNAGINPLSTIEEMDEEDLIECMQINLLAPTLLCQGFVPSMKRIGFGRIINLGSIWSVVAKEKRTVYSISKNGIHGLTNSLAVELGTKNILVNTVCPGFTKTELTTKNISSQEEKKLSQNIPLRRFAEPKEIAEIIYMLGSDKNTYITGQKIVVDGGFTVQ